MTTLRNVLDRALNAALLGGIREDSSGPIPTVDLVLRALAADPETVEVLAAALHQAGLWPDFPNWADPARKYAAAILAALNEPETTP